MSRLSKWLDAASMGSLACFTAVFFVCGLTNLVFGVQFENAVTWIMAWLLISVAWPLVSIMIDGGTKK